MKIPLAEVISHRQLVSPREAATLTLAVGREWDRRRARHGDGRLPDASQIELSDTGEISFADNVGDGSMSADATLSGLLGQLLGVDEQEAPGHQVPGGLLITIAGRLGPMELPSSREDGFRSALLRFADDDPGVLARVFDRIQTAHADRGPETLQFRNAKVRRGPERRRQPPAVAALRRAVRELERQNFEARVANARARTVPAAGNATGRRGTIVLATATAALVISAATLLPGMVSKPVPRPVPVVTQVETPATLVQPSAKAVPAITPVREHRPTVKSATAPTVRARVSAPRKSTSQAHVTFAGGSRAITWARSTR
jgi:hypothetical protein